MTKIIAELCQNHNGDVNFLKDMIWSAADSGATHAKIQTIFSEDLTFRERFENEYAPIFTKTYVKVDILENAAIGIL